jgi:GT2 family glycosyltransferase
MAGLDFIVIGAQKSGTTTLWHLLRNHPQLSLPASKEAPFFAEDQRIERGLDWYIATFFPDHAPGSLLGTVTPQYMLGPLSVETFAARIHHTLPDVKLIAVLRDPVERAISHYRMSVQRGLERRSLQRALSQQLAPAALAAARGEISIAIPRHVRPRVQPTTRYLTGGEYGRILGTYLRYFDRAQLLVLLTAELERDPEATFGQLLSFLGVDDRWRPQDVGSRHLVGGDESRVLASELAVLEGALEKAVPQLPRRELAHILNEWNTLSSPSSEPPLPDDLERRLREHFAADAELLEKATAMRVPWAAAPPQRPLKAPDVERPEVSILVPVHETVDEAGALLGSIVRHTSGGYEIVVVDNGSSPRASDALAALTGSYGARLVRVDDNLVYGHAVNIGLTHTQGAEVCLLNSDVVVTPGWLTNLCTALHSSPDVAIVGPRSNYARWMQGGIWLDDLSPESIDRFGRFFNHSDPTRWFEIDWLSGYAMLFVRATVEAVGAFDEGVQWYAGEDRVLCERLRAAGHRVICAGDTFVYHAGHRTFMRTGLNRTATRFGREPTVAVDGSHSGARILRDGNLVFEVVDGVASHIENAHLVRLVRDGRPVEKVEPSELEQLPVGPPISACRVRGTDQVWVLRGATRQLVTGDRQRVRRLQGLAVVEPDELEATPRGNDLAVENAVIPVPEITPLLPSNPATIEPGVLAGGDELITEIGTALEAGRGCALITLGLQAALTLNDRMWPADDGSWWRRGLGPDLSRAAAALRRAIIDADAVGVASDRTSSPAPELLERVLFHYDLYPRTRYPAEIVPQLLGIDPTSGKEVEGGPLRRLLAGRPVAVVCPSTIAEVVNLRANPWSFGVFQPRLAVPMDDLVETERALAALASMPETFDAVLVAVGAAGIPLCTRLARELDSVAIDVGHAIDRVLHPRYSEQSAPLVHTRWQSAQYARGLAKRTGKVTNQLDGSLVRVPGAATTYYVERGRARAIPHDGLLELFSGPVVEISADALAALPPGAPVCVVHERFIEPYVLLDGRKVRVQLGLPLVELPDFTLDSLPTDDRTLRWFPGA